MRIAVLLPVALTGCAHGPPACPDGRPAYADGACATAQPSPTKKERRPVALTFIFQSLTQVDGHLRERTLAAGETLRTGDQYFLRVEVDQPAQVYVMQKLTTERTTPHVAILYPRGGSELVEPGGLQRIPRSGYFQLQPQPGRERVIREDLFLIADNRRLQPEQVIAIAERQLAQYEKERSPPVQIARAHRPPNHRTGSDGGLLGDEVPGTKSSSYVDLVPLIDPETGARVLHFPFLHQVRKQR